jgi:hypothetical protein
MTAALREALPDLAMPGVPNCGDKVILRTVVGDLSRGALGVVIGYYTNNGDLAVTFDGQARRIPGADVAVLPLRRVA